MLFAFHQLSAHHSLSASTGIVFKDHNLRTQPLINQTFEKFTPKKYFEYPDEIGRKLDLTEIERKSGNFFLDDKPFMHAFKAHLTVIFIVIFMEWLF